MVDSKIIFRDRSSRGGFSGDYDVTLAVEYEFGGELIETEVSGRWAGFQSMLEDRKLLKIGSVIPLRVDPETPKLASLIELSGNP